LAKRYAQKFTDQRQRMAWLPAGAQLIDNPIGAPGFFVEPVYAFPGFPEMLQPMAQEILSRLFGSRGAPPKRVIEMTLKIPEGEIAEEVERFAAEHPDLEIGLYPSITAEGPTVSVRCRCPHDALGQWPEVEHFFQKLAASYPVVERSQRNADPGA